MNELSQEIYKIKLKPLFKLGFLALFLLMCYSILASGGLKLNDAKTLFGGFQWLSLIMVVIGTNIFSSEFEDRTIIQMFYRASNKRGIYLCKIFVVYVYSLLLFLFSLVISLLSVILFHKSWLDNLFTGLFPTIFGGILFLVLFVAVICMVANIFSNSALAIGVDLLIAFFGTDVSYGMTQSTYGEILRWNPFNMLNIMTQVTDGSLEKVTRLPLQWLICGSLIYTVLFLLCGCFFFEHRKI